MAKTARATRVLVCALLLILARASLGDSICQNEDDLRPDVTLFKKCMRTDTSDEGVMVANSIGCHGDCRTVKTLQQCQGAVQRFADASFAKVAPFTCGELEEICEDGEADAWMLNCKDQIKTRCCGGKALSNENCRFRAECPFMEEEGQDETSQPSSGSDSSWNLPKIVAAVGGGVGGLVFLGIILYCCRQQKSAAAEQPMPQGRPAQPMVQRNDTANFHAAQPQPASPHRPAFPSFPAQPPAPPPAYRPPPAAPSGQVCVMSRELCAFLSAHAPDEL
jgi:hypothetical protein